jgi:hypothetical protein
MSNSNCEPRRLLVTEGLSVDHCSACAVFHVHLGPVSLRLDAASLDALLDGLSRARSEAGTGLLSRNADIARA